MKVARTAKVHPVLAFLIAPLAVPVVALLVALGVIVGNGEAAQLAYRVTWLFLAGLVVSGGVSAYLCVVLIGWPAYVVLRKRGQLRPVSIIGLSGVIGILGVLLFWRLVVGPTHAAWGPFVLVGAGGASGGAAGWLFWRILGRPVSLQ